MPGEGTSWPKQGIWLSIRVPRICLIGYQIGDGRTKCTQTQFHSSFLALERFDHSQAKSLMPNHHPLRRSQDSYFLFLAVHDVRFPIRSHYTADQSATCRTWAVREESHGSRPDIFESRHDRNKGSFARLLSMCKDMAPFAKHLDVRWYVVSHIQIPMVPIRSVFSTSLARPKRGHQSASSLTESVKGGGAIPMVMFWPRPHSLFHMLSILHVPFFWPRLEFRNILAPLAGTIATRSLIGIHNHSLSRIGRW